MKLVMVDRLFILGPIWSETGCTAAVFAAAPYRRCVTSLSQNATLLFFRFLYFLGSSITCSGN